MSDCVNGEAFVKPKSGAERPAVANRGGVEGGRSTHLHLFDLLIHLLAQYHDNTKISTVEGLAFHRN